MTLKEIMRFIESEYAVINNTPCEICGGLYITEEIIVEIKNNIPYDICECSCEECGHIKTFQFHAPFIDKKTLLEIKKTMN